MSGKLSAILLALVLTGSAAYAQLPADAVMLDKVKIPETQKSSELCPVHLIAADASVATWEHDGVTYGGDTAACQAAFEKDPATHAKAADRERYINNFNEAMSPIWCPVTDEINPGGGLVWEKLGYTWESCCQFCNESYTDEDFVRGLKVLKERAGDAYDLTGAHYTEGASSPVEGAINLDG